MLVRILGKGRKGRKERKKKRKRKEAGIGWSAAALREQEHGGGGGAGDERANRKMGEVCVCDDSDRHCCYIFC